jgi:hypothetical protein
MVYWKGTRLHFFTERIHPRIASSERPRVMLLFSNPHPDSVAQGLFMSEKRSRGFWDILRSISCPGIKYDFCWDKHGIQETVSLLFSGDYGNRRSPLLFFECLYQIPSRSPKDLKKMFEQSEDFDSCLRRPSLKRIGRIINRYDIETVLVFTRDTFESITNKRISKGSREILRSAVQEAKGDGDKEVFWKRMYENELIRKLVVPNLNHDCIAIKVMDTRAKYWKTDGQSVFSCVLEYALKYAKNLPKPSQGR